jgi:hypothetical protein
MDALCFARVWLTKINGLRRDGGCFICNGEIVIPTDFQDIANSEEGAARVVGTTLQHRREAEDSSLWGIQVEKADGRGGRRGEVNGLGLLVD